jgi:hypothetical protein
MTTYYVSSEIGSNNNAGTSATAPLATLQAAADLVRPGDTVEVMNGTYTGAHGGDVVDLTTSGTASAPITFEAAPGQKPLINSSGCWNAIKIEASYIVVNGFTVVGDAANYTLSQALAGYSTGSAKLDGAGINVTGNPGINVPNHITMENNTVYNEPGAGIGSGYADYLNILNNVVHDNAHWSAFGNSGISIFESANSDTKSGVHDVISGNRVYGNAQLVPTNGAGTITDGEGIILDTNTGFVGEILVENNTAYGNGSAGIESFRTNGAVITKNIVYGNNTANVLRTVSDDEIFINQSNNDTATNNITTAPDRSSLTISSESASLTRVGNNFYLNNTSDPEIKYRGSPVNVGDFGGWIPIGAVQTESGYDVAWKNTSSGQYTVWRTDRNGNYTGNLIGAVSGKSYALESMEATFKQDFNGDGVVGMYAAPETKLRINQALSGESGESTIGAGATLNLSAADSASITFAASTGMLKLDRPSTFSAEIFGFTGNGSLSGSDQIDLKGIHYNTISDRYANGVLTVADATGDTAKLKFNGSYTLANFDFANDGKGGTIVYDPPVPSSGQSTTTPLVGNVALLSNYMASSFASSGSGNPIVTMLVGEAAQTTDQSMLSNPHHV